MDALGSRKNLKDLNIYGLANTYRLINKTTGKVEASGLGRIVAKDTQNKLWAQGVKTTVEAE